MAERNEKKNVQNQKWATAHLSRRLGAGALGAGREGVWQALGVRGRAVGGASDRWSARQQARGAQQQARGGARQAQAGARGAAGWAASAHLGVLNWARLGFCAP